MLAALLGDLVWNQLKLLRISDNTNTHETPQEIFAHSYLNLEYTQCSRENLPALEITFQLTLQLLKMKFMEN